MERGYTYTRQTTKFNTSGSVLLMLTSDDITFLTAQDAPGGLALDVYGQIRARSRLATGLESRKTGNSGYHVYAGWVSDTANDGITPVPVFTVGPRGQVEIPRMLPPRRYPWPRVWVRRSRAITGSTRRCPATRSKQPSARIKLGRPVARTACELRWLRAPRLTASTSNKEEAETSFATRGEFFGSSRPAQLI